jgi:MtN3 and saliva related transmembrane protein
MDHGLLIQIIGVSAGICTASSMLPQLIKTFKKKEVEDISLYMLLILLSGLMLWIAYGFMKKDIPIVATNCFSLIVNVMLIFLRMKYKKGNKGAESVAN